MARFGLLRKIHWDFSAGFPFWIDPCRDTQRPIHMKRWQTFKRTHIDRR